MFLGVPVGLDKSELLRLGGIWAFAWGVVAFAWPWQHFVLGLEISFAPYLSLSACAIEVQHVNENFPTIFIAMFAPKWPTCYII